jgi:hypothetical protein
MPALHPTVVVGYGAYGLSVLNGLLASAATRAELVWDDPPGGAGVSARQLKDLALVAVS